LISKAALEWAEGELKKYNPYHDRLGRFTTAHGAASYTPYRDPGSGKTKSGAPTEAYFDSGYGVRVEQGKFYAIRTAREYRSPKDGTLVGHVPDKTRLQGRVDYIGKDGSIRVDLTHGPGAYSPRKIRRTTMWIDGKSVIDAKEISADRAKVEEAAAVGGRVGAVGTMGALAAQDPALRVKILELGAKKYVTTDAKKLFVQTFVDKFAQTKYGKKIGEKLFGIKDEPTPPPPPDADGPIPAGPSSPKPKGPSSDLATKEPTKQSFYDRVVHGDLEVRKPGDLANPDDVNPFSDEWSSLEQDDSHFIQEYGDAPARPPGNPVQRITNLFTRDHARADAEAVDDLRKLRETLPPERQAGFDEAMVEWVKQQETRGFRHINDFLEARFGDKSQDLQWEDVHDLAYGEFGENIPGQPYLDMIPHKSTRYEIGKTSRFRSTKEYDEMMTSSDPAERRQILEEYDINPDDPEAVYDSIEDDFYFDPDNPTQVITGIDVEERYGLPPQELGWASIKWLRDNAYLPRREKGK
jgi:hypothetical protein